MEAERNNKIPLTRGDHARTKYDLQCKAQTRSILSSVLERNAQFRTVVGMQKKGISLTSRSLLFLTHSFFAVCGNGATTRVEIHSSSEIIKSLRV